MPLPAILVAPVWRTPRAHGGSPEGEGREEGERRLDHPRVALQESGPAAHLLPQGERGGVLQVRTPRLDQEHEGVRPLGEGRAKLLQNGEQVPNRARRRDVHGGWKDVVGALGTVDVVVGVYRSGGPGCPQELRGAVGQHLVDVHVGLGAAAGLSDGQYELGVESARERLVRSANLYPQL